MSNGSAISESSRPKRTWPDCIYRPVSAPVAIDWREPAAAIERGVRAFDPFPGARSRLGDETITCWRGAGRPLAVGTRFAERAALRDSRAALRRQIRDVVGGRP